MGRLVSGLWAEEEQDLQPLLPAKPSRRNQARPTQGEASLGETPFRQASLPNRPSSQQALLRLVREDSPNPYREEACPGFYAAWEGGFQAYLSGETVPEEHLKSPSEASNAWLNGYTAARLSGQLPARTGPARPG